MSQSIITEGKLIEMGFAKVDDFVHDQYHTHRYRLQKMELDITTCEGGQEVKMYIDQEISIADPKQLEDLVYILKAYEG